MAARAGWIDNVNQNSGKVKYFDFPASSRYFDNQNMLVNGTAAIRDGKLTAAAAGRAEAHAAAGDLSLRSRASSSSGRFPP
jgi:hypothetical protein